MLSSLHRYTMKRGLRNPLWDHPTRGYRHNYTVLQCQVHQTSPFSTSFHHPHQINTFQAWLSKGRSTQNMTSLGKPRCVSLRSFKPCTCHRGKVIFLPCLKDILPRSNFQSAHHPKQDRPLLAVRCDRCGGISRCFHTKHWQVEMFL